MKKKKFMKVLENKQETAVALRNLIILVIQNYSGRN
jgi:hypothetical protein